MTEVEQKDRSTAPFQEEANTEQFFTGGGRGAVLSDIKAAIIDNVELVILVGEEGSGKTMLCKMLLEQWDTSHKIILLPQIVESFEDVVRVVAQECDLQYPVDASRADTKKIFLDLVASLQDKGTNLLLICDEAETMYLATLERIRKILDEVNDQGGGLQVLLSGRKSLNGNLEQLDLCDFKEISEKQFFLSTLDDTETWNYLNFCVQTFRGTEEQEVFTREAAAKITSMSRGNLRMINMYADESLQSSNADTSFLVLLDHVKDGDLAEDVVSSGSGIAAKFPFPIQYVMGGGLLLVLLLSIFMFGGNGDKKLAEHKITSQDAPPVLTNSPKQYNNSTAEEIQIKENVLDPVVEEVVAQTPVSEPVIDKKVKVVEKPEKIVPVVIETPVEVSRTPVDISPVEIVEKTPSTVVSEIPELNKQSKIVAEKTKRIVNSQLVIGRNQEKKFPVQTQVPAVKKPQLSRLLKDPVLGAFAAKGEKWHAGMMGSSFSIQLMSLQSDQAQENLKRIVSEPKYQAISDKLVILKRPSNPPVLLLFYGVYPTMAAARNARNTMPIFLRDRHPYPVSVRGALEKARVE